MDGSFISARRAKAHLKDLVKGTRSDGMGAFTSKIYAKQMDGTIYRLIKNQLTKVCTFDLQL